MTLSTWTGTYREVLHFDVFEVALRFASSRGA